MITMSIKIAVVRVRGSVKVPQQICDALKILRLTQVNHAIIIGDDPTYRGMLRKVKDYVTWGEVDAQTIAMLLKERGELVGGASLTDDEIKKCTKFTSIEEFANAVANSKANLKDFPSLKLVFRLKPPRGGYEGIKRTFKEGGALGYRGKEISKLLERMS